jgi:NTP pyrophosphatase (non-canonical NTP hydrolase)
MKFKESYELFLKAWGIKAQSTMCIEEMSELIKELCKLERCKNNEEKTKEVIQNIKEEIADVLNTVEQIELYYGLDDVEKIREQKIERTIKRLN